MTNQTDSTPICCPEFDPSIWDDKTIEWDNKKFIKASVRTLFYMPLNFSSVMKRLNEQVIKAGAAMPDWLCLSDHRSKWKMDVYLSVDKEIEGAENTTLSGNFYTKVYEGPFKEAGNWHKDFENTLKRKGNKSGKIFMWYTTCPKCAKKYGKNYVTFFSNQFVK